VRSRRGPNFCAGRHLERLRSGLHRYIAVAGS
jgi:hypothetical protein